MSKTAPGRIALTALKTLFKKPATTEYTGKGTPKVENHYRGRILYDPTDCIACGLCMRDCPTGAIKIVNEGTKENKKLVATLNVGRCIFCCQCVDSCNKKSLSYSQDIDFAMTKKEDLIIKL